MSQCNRVHVHSSQYTLCHETQFKINNSVVLTIFSYNAVPVQEMLYGLTNLN